MLSMIIVVFTFKSGPYHFPNLPKNGPRVPDRLMAVEEPHLVLSSVLAALVVVRRRLRAPLCSGSRRGGAGTPFPGRE